MKCTRQTCIWMDIVLRQQTIQIFHDFHTALNYCSIKQHAIIYSCMWSMCKLMISLTIQIVNESNFESAVEWRKKKGESDRRYVNIVVISLSFQWKLQGEFITKIKIILQMLRILQTFIRNNTNEFTSFQDDRYEYIRTNICTFVHYCGKIHNNREVAEWIHWILWISLRIFCRYTNLMNPTVWIWSCICDLIQFPLSKWSINFDEITLISDIQSVSKRFFSLLICQMYVCVRARVCVYVCVGAFIYVSLKLQKREKIRIETVIPMNQTLCHTETWFVQRDITYSQNLRIRPFTAWSIGIILEILITGRGIHCKMIDIRASGFRHTTTE